MPPAVTVRGSEYGLGKGVFSADMTALTIRMYFWMHRSFAEEGTDFEKYNTCILHLCSRMLYSYVWLSERGLRKPCQDLPISSGTECIAGFCINHDDRIHGVCHEVQPRDRVASPEGGNARAQTMGMQRHNMRVDVYSYYAMYCVNVPYIAAPWVAASWEHPVRSWSPAFFDG